MVKNNQKIFTPKEIIDEYIKAMKIGLTRLNIQWSENCKHNEEILRELQKNLEKNGFKIINKGVMVY